MSVNASQDLWQHCKIRQQQQRRAGQPVPLYRRAGTAIDDNCHDNHCNSRQWASVQHCYYYKAPTVLQLCWRRSCKTPLGGGGGFDCRLSESVSAPPPPPTAYPATHPSRYGSLYLERNRVVYEGNCSFSLENR